MASFRDRVLPSSPDVFPSICPGRRTTQQFSASLPELGTKRHSGVSCRVLASRHLESAGRDRWACSHNDRRTTLGGGRALPMLCAGGPLPMLCSLPGASHTSACWSSSGCCGFSHVACEETVSERGPGRRPRLSLGVCALASSGTE